MNKFIYILTVLFFLGIPAAGFSQDTKASSAPAPLAAMDSTNQQTPTPANQSEQSGQSPQSVDELMTTLKDPFVSQLPVPEAPKIPVPTPPPEPGVQPVAPMTTPSGTPAPPPLPRPPFSIVGLVWGTKYPQAILNNQSYDQVVTLGDIIDNWTIKSIDQTGVEIKFQEQSYKFDPP